MRDCSLWETNSFCHMQHRAARCASRVPRWQRPMDCPFLSYRSCCSPTTSGCRPAKTFSFFLWCRLPHVDVGSLHSFIQSFEGIALKMLYLKYCCTNDIPRWLVELIDPGWNNSVAAGLFPWFVCFFPVMHSGSSPFFQCMCSQFNTGLNRGYLWIPVPKAHDVFVRMCVCCCSFDTAIYQTFSFSLKLTSEPWVTLAWLQILIHATESKTLMPVIHTYTNTHSHIYPFLKLFKTNNFSLIC